MMQDTWLADLIQESGNEIYIINANSLAFMHINLAAFRNLQYSVAELDALRAPDVMRELDSARLQEISSSLREGNYEQVSIESLHLRKDGSCYPIALRLYFLQIHEVPALIAVGHDQSDCAAGNLESEQDRFSQIESHLPGLLFQLLQKPNGSLTFPYLSKASHNLLGLSAQELHKTPSKFFELILEEDRASLFERLRESRQKRSTLNWEGRIWIEAWQDTKWINLRASLQECGNLGLQWTGLMTNITQSKTQEEEIRRSRQQLAELAAHVENVKEQERARIERDLHDDIGGNLSAIKILLSQLCKRMPADPDLAEPSLYLDALVDRTIESMYSLAADLRPGILDAGLVAALEWLAQEFEEQSGIPCKLTSNVNDVTLDPQKTTALFRIAQEACTNIRKHSHATGVEMHFFDGCNELLLEIIDNGVGMSPAQRCNPKSFGLQGMTERAAALGGTFSIASQPGKGALISVRMPLPENEVPH